MKLEHLSNAELIDAFSKIDVPSWSECYLKEIKEIYNRKKALRDEILRRLNEVWRYKKDDTAVNLYCSKCNKKQDKISAPFYESDKKHWNETMLICRYCGDSASFVVKMKIKKK